MLTIAAVAEHKGILPTQIDVRIRRHTAQGALWQTQFTTEICLGPGLTRRERAILYNSARSCEAHKLLRGEISLDCELSGQAVHPEG